MADKVKHDEVEMSPQLYPEQQGKVPAQLGYSVQPGYPQQPYTAQPGYPGVQGQQSTTTVVMQPTQTIILPAAPRPQNWMGLSIFTCLCCVWPIGLAAACFSSMVDSSYNGGDYEGARRNSKIALWLNIASILCGVGLIVFLIVWFAVVVSTVTPGV